MADEGYKRKLTAILAADVKGYSRLMGEDEEGTYQALVANLQLISSVISKHNGQVFSSPGDAVMAQFVSAVDAVECAIEIQENLEEANRETSQNREMQFRIGINIGDVIEDRGGIFGDGVNIAARIESLAEPGGVSISNTVYDQVCNKLKFDFEYQGEHQVKNIKRPVQIYRVKKEANSTEKIILEEKLTLPVPDKPSIAVLPFDNMSGDPEQDYFTDGITEDIITALSRSPWLFVISRNSSFVYRGTDVDVKNVSKELGVRYILEGSVRKAGNRVRVTAQLIEGTRGSHIWAEKYDGELHDIFDLQDKITRQIVATLLTQIQIYVGAENKQAKRPDIETWDLLARGLKSFYGLTKESIDAAEKIYRTTITSAPTSCGAHWMLAALLFHKVWMGYTSDIVTTISEAYKLANMAISLDDYNEYAHWALGLIRFIQGKHDKAIAELNRAIELNPNCSLSYGSLGTVLSFSGEPEESIKNNDIAIRLNPRDPSIFFRYSGIAMSHYLTGRYSEATHWAQKSIHRKPNWRIGHAILTASFARLKKSKNAKEALENYLENVPNESISRLRKVLFFKNPDDFICLEKGLRMAGLPTE